MDILGVYVLAVLFLIHGPFIVQGMFNTMLKYFNTCFRIDNS